MSLIPRNLWGRFDEESSGSHVDEQRSGNDQYITSINRAPITVPKDKSPAVSPPAPPAKSAQANPPLSTHQPFSMQSLSIASDAATHAINSHQKTPEGSSASGYNNNRNHQENLSSHQWFGGSRAGGSKFQAFNVYDMKSLAAALGSVEAGRGDVRRVLQSANQGNFKPRLPGLTKLVSQLTREGNWQKGLEVFESLDAIEGLVPDTTITNAAISACDKGGQWGKALEVFNSMDTWRMQRDTITYSALISALSKGRNWELSIDVFNHMIASGIETDAVTCCSLITSLDKGGQWQMAEKVFIQMYQDNPELLSLLGCIEDEQTIESTMSLTSSPMMTPSSSPQQPQGLLSSPVQTQSPAVEAISNFMASPNQSNTLGLTVDRLTHLYPDGLDKMPENLTRQLCNLLGDTPGEIVVFREPPRSPQGSASPLLSPLTPPSTPPMTSHLGGQRSLLRASSLNVKKAAPNRVCCNALLAAYSRALPPQYRKALTLLESMWSIGGELTPDLVSYNTAIKAAGNARQIGMAFKVWKVMQSRGCESSQATFGTLVAIASEAGDMGRVREAWAGLRTSGHEVHISSANSQLMACFVDQGSWADGQKLLKEILSGTIGVKANAATFVIVMKACLDHDMSDKVQVLFHQMRELSIAPTSSIFGYLIEAYALRGQFRDALEILSRIFHDPSTRPPLSTFTALFKAIASSALALKGGPAPNQQPLTTIDELRVTASNVRSFLRKVMQPQGGHQYGSPAAATRHHQSPLPPDPVLFNAMVEAYSALDETESCLELYNIAASLGLELDEDSIVRVLCPLCNMHLWSKVVDVVRGLHSGGRGGGMSLELLVCLLKRMNDEKAFVHAYATMRIWMISQVLVTCQPPPPPPRDSQVNPREHPDLLKDLKNAPSTLLLSERLKSEGLVDLLLMCFIIDKETSGEWKEATEMWRWIGKMHADGNGTHFSISRDVRMILFDLMLQSGGVEGLKEAVLVMIESHEQGILSVYKLPSLGSSPCSIQLDGQSSFDLVALLAFLLELSRLAKQGVFITQSQLVVGLKKEQAESISLGKANSNDGRSSLILVLGCGYRSVLKSNEWSKEVTATFPLFKPVLMLNDANDPGKVLVDVRSLYSGLGF